MHRVCRTRRRARSEGHLLCVVVAAETLPHVGSI